VCVCDVEDGIAAAKPEVERCGISWPP